MHHAKVQAGVSQVAARLAAAAAAAVLALGPDCLPSQAVTSEQLLFLEAWRAVDRAYVDKSFNGQNWFKVRQLQPAMQQTCLTQHYKWSTEVVANCLMPAYFLNSSSGWRSTLAATVAYTSGIALSC